MKTKFPVYKVSEVCVCESISSTLFSGAICNHDEIFVKYYKHHKRDTSRSRIFVRFLSFKTLYDYELSKYVS